MSKISVPTICIKKTHAQKRLQKYHPCQNHTNTKIGHSELK